MGVYNKKRSIRIREELIELSEPLVMGILNYTPDSFYDGGRYLDSGSLIERVGQMVDEGADIIDIGACSSRPRAKITSEDEEKERLRQAVGLVRKHFPDIFISVDTFRSRVAELMVDEFNVDMINDISAGDLDPMMLSTIARLKVPYIAMHMQGTPLTMQDSPVYNNVVTDIIKQMSKKIYFMRKIGIEDIIIDPGFGFGKSIEHNYELAAGLESFKIFELPLLVGFSRKSMIYNLLGCQPGNALAGTIALNAIAVTKGANILRVHDVKEAKEIIKVVNKLNDYLPDC